jgi:transcription elongation factor Elf1
MPWTFDCPVCEDLESLVCDLKDNNRRLIPMRMACTNCGYVVGDAQPLIGELLLKDQLTDAVEQKILREYGLNAR